MNFAGENLPAGSEISGWGIRIFQVGYETTNPNPGPSRSAHEIDAHEIDIWRVFFTFYFLFLFWGG